LVPVLINSRLAALRGAVFFFATFLRAAMPGSPGDAEQRRCRAMVPQRDRLTMLRAQMKPPLLEAGKLN
jgi:hypothetical protein